MLKKSLISTAVAAALMVPALSAFAADAAPAAEAAPASPHTFTANVTLASEYIYRGIAQTRGNPAIQGGFDYSHASGLYAGTWASSISWLGDTAAASGAGMEWDIYGGYKNSFAGGDWNYDVGVLTYNYPGHYAAGIPRADTTELYGQIGYKWLTLKYSHVVSSHIFGWTSTTGGKTDGSGYLDLSGSYDLGNGWGVAAHVGHQRIKDRATASYSDWKLGVTKDVGFGVVGLAYTDTNAKDTCSKGEDYCLGGYEAGKGTAVLSFTKTF
ncbi:MAG TPA: TorF family putative porin [Rhodocyclaceae bacterium]